jgi:cyclophilin family peptidyl-prolyl cis-trans isomerase
VSKVLAIFVSFILLIAIIGCSGTPSETVTTTPASTPASTTSTNSDKYSEPPEMTIDVNKNYTATIETEIGDIVIELFPEEAPVTVNNFVFLAREGFYDGITFHRVIPNFAAQAGDPTATGSGGPGYTFDDEINDRKMVTGMVAMANMGANTNGSQFFITLAPQHHLEGHHTIFGEVTDGMAVVARLKHRDPITSPTTVVQGDKIITIKITEE